METHTPEKKLWFKAKQYGYGWYPASWQGWLVLVVYLLLVVFASLDIFRGAVGAMAVKQFLITVGLLTFFLLYISYQHGEKLRWRWGKDDDHGDTQT